MNADTRSSSFVSLSRQLTPALNTWNIYLRLQTFSEPKKLDRKHRKVEKGACFSHNKKESQEIKRYKRKWKVFFPSQILLISSNDENCWGRSPVFEAHALSLRTQAAAAAVAHSARESRLFDRKWHWGLITLTPCRQEMPLLYNYTDYTLHDHSKNKNTSIENII